MIRKGAFALLCVVVGVLVYLEVKVHIGMRGWTVYPPLSAMTEEQLAQLEAAGARAQLLQDVLVYVRISFYVLVGFLLSPWGKTK